MKILIAVDGSSFTKRMLAYLTAHCCQGQPCGVTVPAAAVACAPPAPRPVLVTVSRPSRRSPP